MHLFIMGRPHCGSTILDIMLGNSRLIESVGELTSNLSRFEHGTCGCGRIIAECPFWLKVRKVAIGLGEFHWQTAVGAIFDHAHVRNFFTTLLASRDPDRAPPALLAIADATRHVSDAIIKVSGKMHMLDSTKEATHALLMLKYDAEYRVIHLVRDPRRSVASHYWRFKKDGGYFHYLRRKYHAPRMLVPFMVIAAASWLVGNMLCEINRWTNGRHRTLRVRYEDLSARPASVLSDLASWLDIPLDDVIARVDNSEPLAVRHNIGGNDIRLEREVIFKPKDDRVYDMPSWLNLLTCLVCWPLMLRYGYRMRRLGLG